MGRAPEEPPPPQGGAGTAPAAHANPFTAAAMGLHGPTTAPFPNPWGGMLPVPGPPLGPPLANMGITIPPRIRIGSDAPIAMDMPNASSRALAPWQQARPSMDFQMGMFMANMNTQCSEIARRLDVMQALQQGCYNSSGSSEPTCGSDTYPLKEEGLLK